MTYQRLIRCWINRCRGFSASVCFGLLLLTGCSGEVSYPEHLNYTLRQDGLVERLPIQEPTQLPEAGKLDEAIADLNNKGGQVLFAKELPEQQARQLQQTLIELFGSPSKPTVQLEESDTDKQSLGLTDEVLAQGSPLYRRHCLQCHGLTGDGRGPTGPWIYPHPRDFRQGVFKYVSTVGTSSRKPNRADLQRILANGIPGTSMPSFAMMSQEDRDKLTAYVLHLSIRGQVEYELVRTLLIEGEDGLTKDIPTDARMILKKALGQWHQADQSSILPQQVPTPEKEEDRLQDNHQASVRRGYEAFTAANGAGCLACHQDFGRQTTYRYDVWGRVVRVANLTEPTYHGGKRPQDLYLRIHGGIGPSQMPAVDGPDEKLWDLVHFVQALPYPKLLPKDIREMIYPPSTLESAR